jgi:IMP dehydrogenase
MKCCEIMNSAIHTVRPSDLVLTAARLMRDDYAHFICVGSETGQPLGVVNDYDVIESVCSVDRRPSEVLVHDVMSHQFSTCEVDDAIDVVVRLLLQSGQQRALVVDANGRLEGIVTWTDLLHYLAPIEAQKLALKHVERGFRVRGRSGSTPAPPRGSESRPGADLEGSAAVS